MEILKKIIAKHRDRHADPVTMAFLGDSVTQGCFELYKTGQKTFQTEFRVEDGYPAKLRLLLQMLYPEVPVNMIYAGISGDDTTGGLGRIERDVCAYRPDLTVVSFGLNDCCGGLEKLGAYRESLKNILRKLKESGSEIIFMTPNLMAETVSPEVDDPYMRSVISGMIHSSGGSLSRFVETARVVCREEAIAVCDCYRVWEILKEHDVDTTRLLSNRINHPNEKMHWLFAIMLLKQMFGERVD